MLTPRGPWRVHTCQSDAPASGARELDAGWVMALAIGWLGVLPVAGEDGSLEPVVLAAAACGQVGAWLLCRFVLRASYTDAAADSP